MTGRGSLPLTVSTRPPAKRQGGFTLGGYSPTYTETPNSTTKEIEKAIKGLDQTYGIGLAIKEDGEVIGTIWDSPAFKAGFANGMKIIAVNGTEMFGDAFKATALTQAKADKKPIQLIVPPRQSIRVIGLDYSLGLRLSRLTKQEGASSLDKLLEAKTTSPSQQQPEQSQTVNAYRSNPGGLNPPHSLNVIIEVPTGGEPVKYEFDKASGALFVDRILHTPMRYPANYGFVRTHFRPMAIRSMRWSLRARRSCRAAWCAPPDRGAEP